MSDRCTETAHMRRGDVSLRCDRRADHKLLDSSWHYDWEQDAEWRWMMTFNESGFAQTLSVDYKPEPAAEAG